MHQHENCQEHTVAFGLLHFLTVINQAQITAL